MVKFSREYDASIIPEWKGAFVDYKYLKKLVKKIKVEVGRRGEDDWTDTDALLPAAPARGTGRGFSVLRRSLAARFGREVQVSPVEDEESLYSSWGLVRPAGKHEREFLEKADEELDKANSFYVAQEAKLLGRGEALIDQLRILADVKRILADHAASAGSPDPGPLGRSPASIHPPSSPAHSPGFSGTFLAALSSPRSMSALSGTLLAALASPQSPKSDWGAELQQAQTTTTEGAAVPGNNKQVVVNKARAGGTLQLPSTVRIDIPATNPGRTALKVWEELVNVLRKDGADPAAAFVHRRKIQHAEKNIRNAFIALYRGLDLLKKFSSLNAKAFAKILKKFVKVSGQHQATELFSQKVKKSSFSTSDKVLKLADEVESLFLNHFAGNDIMVAMKYLKPQQPKSTHTMTFLVGLFTGTFMSLFILYALLGNVSGIFGSAENTAYMEVVYHVFSIFTLISLHCFLYGCNLFLWKRTRINTNFIFDFASNTALTHQDAFLMAALIMCTVVAALVINLFLMNAGVTHADVVPGALLALSAAVLLCPFNVFYRSTRYCFMRILRNIAFSPFYKVLIADFFMADQLTSQMPLLRHMEFAACYFMAGRFRGDPHEMCTNRPNYEHLAYLISFLPYYWRTMQCLRRYLEEHDTNQLANAGKYVSAMVAAAFRFKYSVTPTPFWMWMVIVASSGTTVYQLYWDFVKDWGFFTPKSKNPWLRDELILKNKSIYYVSMVLNLALRLAWTESIMEFPITTKNAKRLMDFSIASLEIIRRGHWNFYRLENEHLNNVGKFRAVKTVPLPFHELETD